MSAARNTVLVLGGGHNGLTAAALLAKRGQSVTLIDSNDTLGGLAAPEEFHPGYFSAGVLHDTRSVWQPVIDELLLAEHALQRRDAQPDVLALGAPGDGVVIRGSASSAGNDGSANGEAGRIDALRRYLTEIRPAIESFFRAPPLDVTNPASAGPLELLKRGLPLRRLGSARMQELMRLPPMCVADWLSERLESNVVRAALSLPSMIGSVTGVRAPGSNANFLVAEVMADGDILGGGQALTKALVGAAERAGVQLRTGAAVTQIRCADGRAVGIQLASGEDLDADAIVCDLHPRRVFLDLVPLGAIEQRLEDHVRHYRSRGTTAHVLLAVNGAIRFAAAADEAIEYARIAATPDDVERAFDAVKYRRPSDAPVLDVYVPTVSDASLAPGGASVVSILVHCAPYEIDGGWSDAVRAQLLARVIDTLGQHVPDIAGRVVASRLMTPVDIEERYGAVGGHLLFGEHALDQLLVRPVPECSRYETPLRGLYLCGSASHPGGGLTCAPGALAARAVAAD